MNLNLAPVLLLSCMGLITTSLITILYHDNIDEQGSSHRVLLQQPPPTQLTIQKRKLPSHAPPNIDRGPYAPPDYDPEAFDSNYFQSLCQPQKSAEEIRLATPIVQWERDMYTSISGAQLEQDQKIHYKPLSLFHSTPTSGYMEDHTNPSNVMNSYQRKQSRSSLYSNLADSLNRPLDGAQLYAPRMDSLPSLFTQPVNHPYGRRQQLYIPRPNTSPRRNRRDNMWGESDFYPSYTPFN